VRIVFANLIRNAREAMPQGGALSITARMDRPVGPPDSAAGPADDFLAVAVRDTGVGIPRDQVGRIMEPLYSTKARGLGLGLAIARAILEKNNGVLRVASEPGQGSTFTVFLKVGLPGETPWT
jgi:two-component system sensor kinase FixL